MSGCNIFEEPQCLVHAGELGLLTSWHVVEQVKRLDKPLVVIAISGLYRTGKSYLLNRLAGEKRGFPLGSSIQSKTKGVWIWVKLHPKRSDRFLVLIDTEGLGDVKKGDHLHDAQIFSLGYFLSSHMVYNILNAIDEESIGRIHSMLSYALDIKKRLTGPEAAQPPMAITFCLRDFHLGLEADGREITSYEYMELALKEKEGQTSISKERRAKIKQTFPLRTCHTFDRPCGRKKMKYLDDLKDSELSEDFVKDADAFVEYILQNGNVKAKLTGEDIDGKGLAELLEAYITVIYHSKSLYPIQSSAESYRATMMKDDGRFETYEDFNRLHIQCQSSAMKRFGGDNREVEQKIKNGIECERSGLLKEVEKLSEKKCLKEISSHFGWISRKVEKGMYARKGGSLQYQNDFTMAHEAFNKVKDMGLMKNATLKTFMVKSQLEKNIVMEGEKEAAEKESVQLQQTTDDSKDDEFRSILTRINSNDDPEELMILKMQLLLLCETMNILSDLVENMDSDPDSD